MVGNLRSNKVSKHLLSHPYILIQILQCSHFSLLLSGAFQWRLPPVIACPTDIAQQQDHTHSVHNYSMINYFRICIHICPFLRIIGCFFVIRFVGGEPSVHNGTNSTGVLILSRH